MKQNIHCARLKLYLDPIEIEAYGDDSKQDEVGDDNVCMKLNLDVLKLLLANKRLLKAQEKVKSHV